MEFVMNRTKAELQKQSDRSIDVLTRANQRARRSDAHHRADLIYLRATIDDLKTQREKHIDQMIKDHRKIVNMKKTEDGLRSQIKGYGSVLRDESERCELLIERATQLTVSLADARCELLIERATRKMLERNNS